MNLQDCLICTQRSTAREGTYAPFPEELHQELAAWLKSEGIDRLYSHQAEMFERVRRGENVVITTSTASGKTLGFLLPVLQAVLEDPSSRIFLVYPTKALAADQLRAIKPVLSWFGPGRISAGVYDGDTSPAERSRIRRSANLILTNPEMLNAAFLPNHSRYGFDLIFSRLKYVVIDELHYFRGAFGSHVANVFRRMERICRYYGSKPHFLCSSATIANPLELAGNICGGLFSLVAGDGSPAPEKEYRILQPPQIKGKDDKEYGRVSAAAVAAELIMQLVEEGRHFIAFGHSRRTVEVLLKEARDRLGEAGFLGPGGEMIPADSLIAGYRGGYTPAERREIERKMVEGELLGLVSTNALELGIDIGSLDTAVVVGYPGTKASFWQQTGRAGRNQRGKERSGKKCVNYLILQNQPFDQYIAVAPDWLFGGTEGAGENFAGTGENAIVDKNNLLIQLAHIRAAAAELPLTMDDIALFPDLGEVIPVLLSEQELKSLGGGFAWNGPSFPAGDYSLRNMDRVRFQLLRSDNGRLITEMDESQAYHELYPGAVYMHEGALYEVSSLSLPGHTALAAPFSGNYYTTPAGSNETRILQTRQEKEYGRISACFGDINIEETVAMYKRLQFHNHQNLGYTPLEEPLSKEYETESAWIRLPGNVVKIYRGLLQRNHQGELVHNNHFEGMAWALKNAAMMVTMAERDDIDTAISNDALLPEAAGGVDWEKLPEENTQAFLFLYDRYVGGLGYSEKIYERLPEIVENAIRMVSGCHCSDGCPACVGDYTLDKGMVLWGLKNLLESSEPPRQVRQAREEARPGAAQAIRRFCFEGLPGQWEELRGSLEGSREPGAAFLCSVSGVQVKEETLILQVENAFLEQWLAQPENCGRIEEILRRLADCPKGMQIVAEGKMREDGKAAEDRLRRRYQDVVRR